MPLPLSKCTSVLLLAGTQWVIPQLKCFSAVIKDCSRVISLCARTKLPTDGHFVLLVIATDVNQAQKDLIIQD